MKIKEFLAGKSLAWIVIFLIIAIILTFFIANSEYDRGGFINFGDPRPLELIIVWVAFVVSCVALFILERKSQGNTDRNAGISLLIGIASVFVSPMIMISFLMFLGVLLKLVGIDY